MKKRCAAFFQGWAFISSTFWLKSLRSSIVISFMMIKSFQLKIWPSTAVAVLHCLRKVHWFCPLGHWVKAFQVLTVFWQSYWSILWPPKVKVLDLDDSSSHSCYSFCVNALFIFKFVSRKILLLSHFFVKIKILNLALELYCNFTLVYC